MTEKNAKSCYGKISLAGDLGSGKSTVSKILIERLGATYYSTGAICRAIAAKHGMDIVEMNLYMETHPEIDTEIDDGLRALSDKDECMIIDSRMAWHFVRDTFKVYMTTELAESAKRILRAGRAEEQAETVEELAEKIRTRKASERRRYSEMYGVDCKDLSNYSLVVDSTYASPEEVAECILSCFADWQEDHSRTYAYVCPRRFLYPDEGTDEGRAAKLSELMDAMKQNHLEPKRMTFVHADMNTPPSTVLVEAKKGAAPSLIVTPPLLLHPTDDKTGNRPQSEDAVTIYRNCSFTEFFNKKR